MRRAVVLGLIVLGCAAPVAASWKPSIFDGESRRSIQGCAAKSTDDSWSCAFIRCEPGNRLGLYLDVPGALAEGPITLAVGARSFVLALESTPPSPFGGALRVVGAGPELVPALAAGTSLRIVNYGISSGYDAIPLTGIASHLRRIEQACKPR